MASEMGESSVAAEAIVDVAGVENVEECPICLDELGVTCSQTVVMFNCNHQFHLG